MVNVVAEALTTLDWLKSAPSISIPVYQRDYRWNMGSCDQLLSDVRAIANEPEGRTHFIGSILATPDDSGGVTLVDGQQRVTTIMLLLAAIHSHAVGNDDEVAQAVRAITAQPGSPDLPRLRPHERHLQTFSDVINGLTDIAGDTTFEQNYLYLVDRLSEDWPAVWQGLQRLEHVMVALQPTANAQQIFESLNSTGAALSDDELIHNYIHMGRSRDEQEDLEQHTWIPIEEATAGRTRSFWRDYLVLTSSAQVDFSGNLGVYRAFRERYPNPRTELTSDLRAEWVRQAERYGVLLHPERESDAEISEQLDLLRAFEGGPRPVLLQMYGDFLEGHIDKDTALSALEQIQAMLIRRNLVRQTTDIGLAGTIVREMRKDRTYPVGGILGRTPEDDFVKVALTHSSLPRSGYVLRRIQKPEPKLLDSLQVEHIYPQNPRDDWTGGGAPWSELGSDERAEYRSLLNTIGNLTLLESNLNAGAGNRSFQDKTGYYKQSAIDENKELAERPAWDTNAITQRTQQLIKEFLMIWPRVGDASMDQADDLTRLVHFSLPPTNMADPDRFEYAVFKDQQWGDTRNVKTLLWRLAQELDAMDPVRLREADNNTLIKATKAPHTKHADGQLSDGSYLYTGWATRYLLKVAHTWVKAFGLDDEVKVKLLEPLDPIETLDSD